MATIAGARDDDALLLIRHEATKGCAVNGHLGQSLWLQICAGKAAGPPPPTDLAQEKRNGSFIREAIAERLVSAIHDISDGGTLVAIAEMALARGCGFNIAFPETQSMTGVCFGEDQGRYLVAVPMDCLAAFEALARSANVGVDCINSDLSDPTTIRIGFDGPDNEFQVPLTDLRAANERFFREWMEQ